MRLLLLSTLLLRVAADELAPLTAYAGATVTLSSGADPQWELSAITWSIWTNTTWIATYADKSTNENLFYKYRGRLHLNAKTGDLTITNVSSADEIKYTVDFFNTEQKNKVNAIQLRIKQRLNQPSIQKTLVAARDSCLLALHCSSSDPGVSLSWESDPHLRTLGHDRDFLMAVLNKTHTNLNFTCVARKNSENATKMISIMCEEPAPPSSCPPSAYEDSAYKISRDPVFFVPGFFVCFCVCVFAALLCVFVKQWRTAG